MLDDFGVHICGERLFDAAGLATQNVCCPVVELSSVCGTSDQYSAYSRDAAELGVTSEKYVA